MIDVSKEGALWNFALEHSRRGGEGFLISGGCDPEGIVPYPRDVLQDLARIKREMDLTVNVHSGFVGPAQAEDLAMTGIDTFSFDMVTDGRVLR
jgi:lipoyl synthase